MHFFPGSPPCFCYFFPEEKNHVWQQIILAAIYRPYTSDFLPKQQVLYINGMGSCSYQIVFLYFLLPLPFLKAWAIPRYSSHCCPVYKYWLTIFPLTAFLSLAGQAEYYPGKKQHPQIKRCPLVSYLCWQDT